MRDERMEGHTTSNKCRERKKKKRGGGNTADRREGDGWPQTCLTGGSRGLRLLYLISIPVSDRVSVELLWGEEPFGQ